MPDSEVSEGGEGAAFHTSSPKSGSGAMAILTKKVGPLPLWTWVAAGALVAVFVIKRKKGTVATSGKGIVAQGTPLGGGSGTMGGSGSYGYNDGSYALSGQSGVNPIPVPVARGGPVGMPSPLPPPVQGGPHYTLINTLQQLDALQKAGQTTYIQPIPGDYVAATPGTQYDASIAQQYARVP